MFFDKSFLKLDPNASVEDLKESEKNFSDFLSCLRDEAIEQSNNQEKNVNDVVYDNNRDKNRNC